MNLGASWRDGAVSAEMNANILDTVEAKGVGWSATGKESSQSLAWPEDVEDVLHGEEVAVGEAHVGG